MNTPTPVKDLEQHLRTHYHEEFGDPPPASALWSTLANRLPAQEHPQSWWQRWLQALSPSGVALTSAPRRVSTRRIVLTGSLALAILLLASGAFYTASTFGIHPSSQAPVTINTDAASTALLSSLVKSDARSSTLAFTSTNQTQSTSSNTVRLQQTYADANNIVIGYTDTSLSKLLTNNAPTITLPNHQTLKPTQMLIKQQGNTYALLAYFDASSIQGNPQQVQLSISIPTQSTIAHFNTTVPVTAGKIVNINQSVTSKGYTATIDRVVMTPSETRFYYSTTDKNLNQLYAKNLLIGGQAFIGTNSTGPAQTYTSTGPAQMLEIWMGVKRPYVSIMTDLQNKTGSWVLNVSAPGQPDLNWQFTLNIQ
jgi:hypothetical protein